MPSSSTASPPVAAAVEHDSDVVELRSFAKSAGDVEAAARAEASTSAASADAEEVVDPEERWEDLERIGDRRPITKDDIDRMFAGVGKRYVPAMNGVMKSLKGLTEDMSELTQVTRETARMVAEHNRDLRRFQQSFEEKWKEVEAAEAAAAEAEARYMRLVEENKVRFKKAS